MKTVYDLVGDYIFDALLRLWEQDRRCPIALVDYLQEQGLDKEEEAARWAATQPDRVTYHQHKELCGPFPITDFGNIYWCTPHDKDLSGECNQANCVPRRCLPAPLHGKTYLEALLGFLATFQYLNAQATI